jgi:hypothetical protein
MKADAGDQLWGWVVEDLELLGKLDKPSPELDAFCAAAMRPRRPKPGASKQAGGANLGAWLSINGFLAEVKRIFGDIRSSGSRPARSELGNLIQQAGTRSFRFRGVTVLNTYRLVDAKIANVLNSFSAALAVFKREGVEDVVPATVNNVSIDPMMGVAGRYYAATKTVAAEPRAINPETMVHEIAHHVDWKILSNEARRYWASYWEEQVQPTKIPAPIQITSGDRERIFEKMLSSGWSPRAISRGLGKEDREKALFWLHEGGYLSSSDSFRVSPKGEETFERLRGLEKKVREELGPWGFTEDEILEELNRNLNVFKRDMGVHGSPTTLPAPAAPTQAEVAKQLGLPSAYAAMNPQEDFAESLMFLLTDPSKLSEVARYRIKRTLWLSDFGGKPVMRVARLLELYRKEITMRPRRLRMARRLAQKYVELQADTVETVDPEEAPGGSPLSMRRDYGKQARDRRRRKESSSD